MTRIGMLVSAVVRCAMVAALAVGAADGLAQSPRQPSSSDAQWKNRSVSPAKRRVTADSSSDWSTSAVQSATKITSPLASRPPAWNTANASRQAVKLQAKTPNRSAPSTRWITPKRAVDESQSTAAGSSSSTGPSNAVKPGASPRLAVQKPRQFVPPADAQQLRAANRVTGAAKSATSTQRRPTSQASAAPRTTPAPRARAVASRTQRTNNRPNRIPQRPRPQVSNPLVGNDGWIRPLKQVAYQITKTEELPGSPEIESLMVDPTGPQFQTDDQWLGGDDDGSINGGQCGDGGCGEICGCADGCRPTCGCGVCEPGCGCEPGYGSATGSCGCGDDVCGCIGNGDPESCHTVRIRLPRIQEIVIFGGVHGFKGPYDLDRDGGNFGFQEGINVGAKLPYCDVGYQFGFQSTQSQLSGDAITGDADTLMQHFGTAGLFHRSRDGFQGGVVWDILSDERNGTVEFEQMRVELSYVECGRHEWGTSIAVHLDEYYNGETAFQAADQYTVFYRLHGKHGGEGRVFTGLTDDVDALLGADFLLPLLDRWSLQSEFTYLIPSESAGSVGARQEAWNIGINLVWHWKGRARKSHSNPYRPLFDVADNGSLIIDNRP